MCTHISAIKPFSKMCQVHRKTHNTKYSKSAAEGKLVTKKVIFQVNFGIACVSNSASKNRTVRGGNSPLQAWISYSFSLPYFSSALDIF